MCSWVDELDPAASALEGLQVGGSVLQEALPTNEFYGNRADEITKHATGGMGSLEELGRNSNLKCHFILMFQTVIFRFCFEEWETLKEPTPRTDGARSTAPQLFPPFLIAWCGCVGL